jgi:HEAT repeat protein
LEKALENEDPVYRAEAALALWKIARHPKAIPTLEAVIRQGGAEGPYEAIMALREVGQEAMAVTDTLVATLAHRDADLRRAAAKVLAGLGPAVLQPVAQLLLAGNLESPESAAYVLGEVIADLRANTFYNRQVDQGEFVAAARPVFRLAVPALVGLLSHQREEVRQVASQSLAQMGIVAALGLMDVLNGEHERARQSAIDTLFRLEQFLPSESPSSEGVEVIKGKLVALLMALMEHPVPEVRAAAYRAFAAFSFGEDGKAALPLLLKALKDPNVSIRRYATKARDELLKK